MKSQSSWSHTEMQEKNRAERRTMAVQRRMMAVQCCAPSMLLAMSVRSAVRLTNWNLRMN